MHWLSILVWLSCRYDTPLYRWQGSLFMWVGAFHIRRADYLILLSDIRATYPFHSPHFIWPCLPWPSPMLGHIPLGVHYLPASTGRDVIPSALCIVFLLKCAAKSHYLWSSTILSGCSSRCPWEMPQLPIFPPQGSFTGRSLGDHLTTFLLCHPLFLTSYRGSLVWGGAGTPVPCMMAVHTQGNANLWCDEKKSVLVEDLWPSALVHHFIRGDISCDLMHHLPSLFFPPILDLPLSLPGISLH